MFFLPNPPPPQKKKKNYHAFLVALLLTYLQKKNEVFAQYQETDAKEIFRSRSNSSIALGKKLVLIHE